MTLTRTSLRLLLLLFAAPLPAAEATVIQQRPIDRRVPLLNASGFDPGGLCPGAQYRAVTAAQFNALSGRVRPGDQVILGEGAWNDAGLKFHAEGTLERPILVRGAGNGRTVFGGRSTVSFSGHHLIVSDLNFRGVTTEGKSGTILRLGTPDQPAGQCILHRIHINGCNTPDARIFYLTTYGSENTIDHCEFVGLRSYGQMIAAQELPPNRLLGLHVLNCLFEDRPYVGDRNGYEVIQIGWSGEKARSAAALLQGNTFRHCDGENELITLKASDVVVRDNQFLGCQGVLCLRSANRVRVENNVFDGEDRPNTGGIRIQGAQHIIVGNTFRRLRKPASDYYRTISMMAASAEDTADDVEGYGRAKHIRILNNYFENNDTRIAVGIYPRPQYPLLPQDIVVEGNVFADGKGANPFDFIAPDATGTLQHELTTAGNRFEAGPVKVGSPGRQAEGGR